MTMTTRGRALIRPYEYRKLILLVWMMNEGFVDAEGAKESSSFHRDEQEHGPTNEMASSVTSSPVNVLVDDLHSLQLNPFANFTAATSSASCQSHATCEECNQASTWCHWCDSDSACHARGSVHGCLYGSSCTDDDDDNKKKKKQHDDKDNNTGCSSHLTCTDCTASSRTCHWCAHDNACHAIGSYYGCLTGVNCYSNSRCERAAPEPIGHDDHPLLVPVIGDQLLPVVLIFTVAVVLGCCLSACFCFASSVKSAYDDVLAQEEEEEEEYHYGDDYDYGDEDHGENRMALLADTPVEDSASSTEHPHLQQIIDPATVVTAETETDQARVAVNVTVISLPQEDTDNSNGADYVRMTDEEEQQHVEHEESESRPLIAPTRRPEPPRGHGRRRPRRGVQRLYNVCSVCYVASLFVIGGIAFSIYSVLPLAPPAYNVCNEESDWKSLIESMSTDFEILVSVANPNRVSFALDAASGNFSHRGYPVGSFKLAPVVIEPMAITDLLVIAHFAPDKWDAISIGREFVTGKLTFMANVSATVRVPILFDYSITAGKQDVVIHVNQLGDRSLCACSDWKNQTNSSSSSTSSIESSFFTNHF